jgi:hypothetical protein
MNLIGISVLLLSHMAAEDKPAPKLPIGKDTTYVEGPLDKDGYIDYEAALNDLLSKGITPERNANVLLWKAFGPRSDGDERVSAQFFKRLGIKEPLAQGDYFIELKEFKKEHLKLDKSDSEAFDDQESRAIMRPWTAKDYPQVAAWLKANEKPLVVVVEATKRPDYYNPMICQRNETDRGPLIGVMLPGVQKCRDLAHALAARAMQRVGAGQFDEAWQDQLACHRLGRLVARGSSLIEALVGIAIDSMAARADLVYLERGRQTPKYILDRLKELQQLPPIPPTADKMDLGARIVYLDLLRFIRRNGIRALEDLSGKPAKKPEAEDLKRVESIDWDPVLRTGNRWFDRITAALRIKDREDCDKALAAIEKDLKVLKAAAVPANFGKLVQGDDPLNKSVGKTIGDVFISLFMPAYRQVHNAYERNEQEQRNLYLAFALAAYHSDNRRYPAKLDELAPKYMSPIPDDLYSGKALIYRPLEKGYLLYSVGANRKDDEGRSSDDNPRGDDLSVRMPLPELKAKK